MSIYADDACYNMYIGALKAYNSGDYIEAQRKFIIVAQTCGDYQEVYKKLRDCNTKLKEKQTAYANEISTLKENNRKLTEQYSKKEAENKDLRKTYAVKITGLDNQLNVKSHQLDSVSEVLKNTETKLDSAEKNIQRLKQDSALLRQELDSVTHLKDSLQKKLDWWKIKKDTVKDDDKKLNEEILTKSQKDKDKDKGSEKKRKKSQEKNPTPAKQDEPSEVEQEQKSNLI
mgnify:CR=1 FL=1